MIVFNLLCENAHTFEGWFASTEAFVRQRDAGQISCPVCGSSGVQKRPSAPHVHTRSAHAQQEQTETVLANPDLLEKLRARMLEYIVENTEDVGVRFPDEARAIHHERAPQRSIRGKATQQEADALRDEGIEVFALPLAVPPKSNLH